MARRTLVKRERIMIVCAFAVFALILLLFFVQGFKGDYERTRTQAEDAVDRLIQIRQMRELVLGERSDRRIIMDRVEARDPNFDLYSFTNAALMQLSMHGNARLQSEVRFAGSALDGVRLNLTNVKMKQIIDLLHKLYSSGNLIALQRLGHLRPMRDGKGLECEIVLMAPKA